MNYNLHTKTNKINRNEPGEKKKNQVSPPKLNFQKIITKSELLLVTIDQMPSFLHYLHHKYYYQCNVFEHVKMHGIVKFCMDQKPRHI